MSEREVARRLCRQRFASLHERLGALAEQDGEPHADRFSREKWALVCESGLAGLPFERRHGGLGEDLLTTMYVLEDLGYCCREAGLSFSLCTHLTSTGVALQRFGSTELEDRYMPGICDGSTIGAHAITEPTGGSDVLGMQTRAVDEGEHFVLTGTKAFVTNGPVADLLVIYARTKPEPGPFGLSAFLVERDTPGLRFGGPVAKMGLAGSPVGEVVLDRCKVAAANLLGAPGSGFLVLEHVMKWEILCTFAGAAGAMRRRLERCVDYARTRQQFGRPIGSFELLANKLVDMKIAIETAHRWLYDTAARLLRGEDVTSDIAIAKLLASEANLSSALAAVQIFAANGYTTASGLEADVRDAVGGTIYSGTSEMQRKKIARMLGLGEHMGGPRRPPAVPAGALT